MRLLVTGGAGFIGSNFVCNYLDSHPEAQVVVIDALTYAGNLDNLRRVKDKIRFVHGDIRDKELVADLVKDSDFVVHFAAESHNDNSLKNPALFFDVNLNGTMSVANACLKHDVRLHHVSTDEVFGDLPLDSGNAFFEESPYKPSSPYSASKASSDHLLRAWHRSFGLQVTISNCSNNYGENQHFEKLLPTLIRALHRGEIPKLYGDGLNVRDWIHVSDHCNGIVRVMEDGKIGETYLLGARDEVSNLAIARQLNKLFGYSEDRVEFIPDRPGHDRRYAINPAKAERELGWRATHPKLLASLQELVSTYREEG
jgi:dTDP-glucose 4,6-dehydratase